MAIAPIVVFRQGIRPWRRMNAIVYIGIAAINPMIATRPTKLATHNAGIIPLRADRSVSVEELSSGWPDRIS